jgi:hypothetical protein
VLGGKLRKTKHSHRRKVLVASERAFINFLLRFFSVVLFFARVKRKSKLSIILGK